MGGRKQKMREPKPGIYIVGEGITEQYYFAHLKKIFGYQCTIKPRFFGNTNIVEMRKKIEELLRDDIFVICVFDADVSTHNESERRKLEQFQKKYRSNKNLVFCDSFPSIEYWFLLHYLETNRYFKDSKEAEKALKRYIQEYEKTTSFLENEKWVRDLCSESKLSQTIERSKRFEPEHGSYSNVYKAFEVLRKDLESNNLKK
jgi:hypothetical protein